MKQHRANSLRASYTGHIAVLSILIMSGFCTKAQTTDSMPKPAKEFKNTIKFNLTSRILYDNAWQLSYERLIKKNKKPGYFWRLQ
jgi:hypothetical protein